MPAQQHLTRQRSSFRGLTNALQSAGDVLFRTSSGRHLITPSSAPSRWGVLGVANSLQDDFTFHCIDMRWRSLLVLVLAVYVAVAALFALAFWLLTATCRDCEDRPHLVGEAAQDATTFESCFWFSVNNVITIGYGSLLPATTAANALCTAEHFTGILLSSILLGIIVTKASLPTSKIIFSRVCLITNRNGVPHLLIRIGNTRGNFLLNPEIRISYLKRLVTTEGEITFSGRRLDYSDPPAMAPSVNIAHRIDPASPLWNVRPRDIADEEGGVYVSVSATDSSSLQAHNMHVEDMNTLYPLRILSHRLDGDSPMGGKLQADVEGEQGYISCLVSGTDDHFCETVYARQIYRAIDIRWNHRFKDMLVQRDGRQFVDFNNLHDTVPISSQAVDASEVLAKRDSMYAKYSSAGGDQKKMQPVAVQEEAGELKEQASAAAGASIPERLATQEESAEDTFRQSIASSPDGMEVRRRPSKTFEELTGMKPMDMYDSARSARR